MATSNYGWDSFFSTTLASAITATDTTIPLVVAPTATEGTLVIESNSATNREIIYYTGVSGSNVTLPSVGAGRGQEGTSAMAHSSGVSVKRNTTSRDFEVLQDMTATGDDKVLARHIDWASTGANGGIWWEELGRTTLGGTADSISVASLSARKYLLVLASLIPSGQISGLLRFNNDSGSNYALRLSVGGGADTTATSASSLAITPTETSEQFSNCQIVNISNQEKLIYTSTVTYAIAGAGTAPSRVEGGAKWVNTSAQITRVDIINGGTGDFAAGSEVIVLGHN